MRHAPAFALVAALAAAAPARAQVARLEVLEDTVLVGQPFRVLLVVRPPAGAYPLLPAPADGARRDSTGLFLGQAQVLGYERRPPHILGRVRVDSALYDVAIFTLDSATVGPLDYRIVAGADTLPARAAALTVTVGSTSTEADSLRPPGPPLDVPRAWGPWALLAVALGVGAALAARTLIARRRRPARASAHAHLPPLEQAMARLDALSEWEVDTDAGVEAHHVELSDAARTYLERALGLAAHRLTTAGVAAALAKRGAPAEATDELVAILRETDMVKFAARRPGPDELDAARARTRMALERVEEWLRNSDGRSAMSDARAHRE